MGASAPVVELPREEVEEEEGEGVGEDRRRGSSATGNLAPQQVPAPQLTMPAGPGIGS